MLGLARPLIKPALGALASAGLSFGAEKVLKKIFGKGFGPKEIELYKLVQRMSPDQTKEVEQYLVGQGVVRGGAAQYGGFLGLLASIGLPLAIDLVKKILGKGLQTHPPRPRRSPRPPPPPKGRGMQMRPPPFFGTWDDYEKKKKFKDIPLSNIDLENWCDYLRIPIPKAFLAETKRNPCPIPRALSTWMILEVWELTGCVAGVPKMARTSRNINAQKVTFFQKRQPNSMGTKCEMWLLLPSLFKRKKQRNKFRQHFENVHQQCSSKRKHRKELFFIRYTKMEVYCVKEKRHTPNAKGSEKVVIT